MSSKLRHANKTLLESYSLSSGMRDKSYSRYETFLSYCVICAILLPTAAQSVLGFLWVLIMVMRRGVGIFHLSWWRTNADHVAPLYKILLFSLFALWASHFLSLIVELIQSSKAKDWLAITTLHVRLLLKQGVYGLALIVCSMTLAFERRKLGLTPLNPKPILIFSIILTLYMLAQRYWGWNFVHGFGAVLGEHRFAYGVYRASGFMGHPLSMAFNALLFGLLCLAQALFLYRQKHPGAGTWLLLAILMTAQLFLTGSRYPLLLMLLCSFGLLVWEFQQARFRKGSLKVLIGIGFFLLTGLLFGLDPNLRGRIMELFAEGRQFEESFDRIVFWKVNLSLAQSFPWSGTGLFSYPGLLLDYYNQAGYTNYERKYAAHNIFIQTFADMGLIGSVGLFAFLVGLIGLGWRTVKSRRHTGIAMLSVATFTSGLMQNNLRDSEFLFALWAGVGLTLSWLVEQGMASEPTESRTNFENYQS